MRTAETTAEIRSLTDAELDDVNGGGALAAATVLCVAVYCAVAANAWDLPIGGTVEEGKEALGLPQTDTLKPLPT